MTTFQEKWTFFVALAKEPMRWDIREWSVVSVALQIALLVLYQIAVLLLPQDDTIAPPLMMTELDFVEFTEIQEQVAEKQELSDTIVEKEKLSEKPPVNWNNAADPTLDLNQRYVARLYVNLSPDDYPKRARRANAGIVKVGVTLYIAADGTMRDVKIRSISGEGNTAELYREDFIRSVRNIILNKTRLMNRPYNQDGTAHDFSWDTVITFTLQ